VLSIVLRSRILEPILFLLLFLLWDWIGFIGNDVLLQYLTLKITFIFIGSLILLLFLQSLFYPVLKKYWPSQTRFIFIIFIWIFSFWFSERLLEITSHFKFEISGKSYVMSNIWSLDDYLGHAAIPETKGEFKYTISGHGTFGIPVSIDLEGRRMTQLSDSANCISFKVAIFGCSFTFGDFVQDHQTYASQLAQQTKYCVQNWGGSGYGLAQMQMRFDTLLKYNPPDLIVLQYSPWLAKRSSRINRDAFFGTRGYPYYSSDHTIVPPIFKSSVTPYKDWSSTKETWINKNRFLLEKGWSTNVSDVWRYYTAKSKIFLGLAPRPIKNLTEIEEHAYNYFVEKATQLGIPVILLKLKYFENIEHKDWFWNFKKQNILVDGDVLMSKVFIDNHTAPYEIFHYFDDGSKFLINNHPNITAHKLIADELEIAIGEIFAQKATNQKSKFTRN
jgi:hypothetical protein